MISASRNVGRFKTAATAFTADTVAAGVQFCIPVGSIFDPVKNPNICPSWTGRWELRTKTLGCGCSTLTLLAVLITIVCTLAALSVLFGVYKLITSVNKIWGFGALSGSYLKYDDGGHRHEGLWFRKWWWLPRWVRPRRIELGDYDT
ncbi:hypothetical protein ANO11243_019490 [Dothideomycetidae sp. 11243]|nr:hypothetical protein ANO11243_019490 [fungal sp. No.11243]